MKNRAVTLLLCLMLAALSILRAFPASAEGITPATAADFDLLRRAVLRKIARGIEKCDQGRRLEASELEDGA